MINEIKIREAGPNDLETILHHRRSMFRDMGEGTVDELDRMVEVARPWMEERWPTARTGIGWRLMTTW